MNHIYLAKQDNLLKQKLEYNKLKNMATSLDAKHLNTEYAQGIANTLEWHNVIMGAMASQITSLTIVYSTVYSGVDQRKHQSSVSLAFVRGIHRWPVNSPHKGPVTWKMFLFHDVIMIATGWTSVHKMVRRLTTKSHEISKPRDLGCSITRQFDRRFDSNASWCLSNCKGIRSL